MKMKSNKSNKSNKKSNQSSRPGKLSFKSSHAQIFKPKHKEKDFDEETEHRDGRRGKNSKDKSSKAKSSGGLKPVMKFYEKFQKPEASKASQKPQGPKRSQSGRGQKGPAGSQLVVGIVKRHPDGFGFMIPDDSNLPDVYIPRRSMTGVMGLDKVRVRVTREPGGDRYQGEIEEIVSRGQNRVIGPIAKINGNEGVIEDRSFSWGGPMYADLTGHNVKVGTWVAVQVEQFPEEGEDFRGRVIQVLGDLSEAKSDSLRMLHSHQIPFEFSKKTLKEVDVLANEVTAEDKRGRKDLTKMDLITIDGKTAKDFDDAVFAEKTNEGFHLVVAIADVSHYVKPGTALDDDAYERGTSTYFPNFVAPMLPEKLSNNLCSLMPKVDRLCFVCDMQIDFSGAITSYEFYEAVMNSKARVTYGQAQEVIEGRTPAEIKHVETNIKNCENLAKILMAKRFREGSLELELPETQIEIDDQGEPVDIFKSQRLFAHRLIEELMLVTNIAAATFFKDNEMDGFFRIHEEPKAEAIMNLEKFLRLLGFNKSVSGGHMQKKLTNSLQEFKGHAKEHILNMLTLRSMAQARYSPENMGHFGLGFSDYSHFTSPIRRYPDLIVHRLIKAVLYPEKGYRKASREDLDTAGTMLSACEQRSVKAERQIHSIKKARFIQRFVGEEFEGTINSVTNFGIFVMLRQFDIDGLIRLEELGVKGLVYDEENMRLVGKKSGISFEIGDPIKIVVSKVDIEDGKIDFALAADDERGSGLRGSHGSPNNAVTKKRR